MRRKDKEVTVTAEMEAILEQGLVCHLGLADRDDPYVVPLCYGYRRGCLYLHSALEGKKVEMLRRNPRVCFAVDLAAAPIPSADPCKWTIGYRSVIGYGTARFVEDDEAKCQALDVIVSHYGGDPGGYDAEMLAATLVIEIKIESMTAKRSGD